MLRRTLHALVSLAAIAATTVVLKAVGMGNPTTIALTFLMAVLFVAATAELWTALLASIAAILCFNFFFLPPVGKLTLADPSNWVALFAFLVITVVASRLSASARARAQEALDRGNELTRLLADRRDAELTRQRAELSAALLASLSHDLRTPLTAIRTAVTNLESDVLAEDQRRDQARVASGQLERLARLFDEILDMARIDSGSVQPQRAWTTPAEVVEAALSYVSPDVAELDFRIDARDDVAVEIDPRLASTALAHYLENAAQYASTAPIHVRGWTEQEGLRLEVRDEGPGLQSHELERLFEPFYRGELQRHRVPGTGMGLAITRGLVAADGGRAWAENVAPHGASFNISVPARTRAVASGE